MAQTIMTIPDPPIPTVIPGLFYKSFADNLTSIGASQATACSSRQQSTASPVERRERASTFRCQGQQVLMSRSLPLALTRLRCIRISSNRMPP
jgi:hypothetical protein